MMIIYNNKNKYRLSLRTLYGGRQPPADEAEEYRKAGGMDNGTSNISYGGKVSEETK